MTAIESRFPNFTPDDHSMNDLIHWKSGTTNHYLKLVQEDGGVDLTNSAHQQLELAPDSAVELQTTQTADFPVSDDVIAFLRIRSTWKAWRHPVRAYWLWKGRKLADAFDEVKLEREARMIAIEEVDILDKAIRGKGRIPLSVNGRDTFSAAAKKGRQMLRRGSYSLPGNISEKELAAYRIDKKTDLKRDASIAVVAVVALALAAPALTDGNSSEGNAATASLVQGGSNNFTDSAENVLPTTTIPNPASIDPAIEVQGIPVVPTTLVSAPENVAKLSPATFPTTTTTTINYANTSLGERKSATFIGDGTSEAITRFMDELAKSSGDVRTPETVERYSGFKFKEVKEGQKVDVKFRDCAPGQELIQAVVIGPDGKAKGGIPEIKDNHNLTQKDLEERNGGPINPLAGLCVWILQAPDNH